MVATSRMWVSFCVLPMHARPGLRGEIPIRRLLDTQLVFRGPVASAAIGIGAAHESTVLGVAVRMRSREVVDVGFGVDPHDGIAAAAGVRLCLAGELILAPRVAVTVAIAAGLAAAGRPTGRAVFRGLSVLRAAHGRTRLVGFVLVAVVAQIARNWLMLHAVGIDASVFDAIAVLIAVVMLGQLPIGPTAGAGAAVLILGPQGVVGAAAAGIMLTATGTIGGVLVAAWAGLDRLHSSLQVAAGKRDHAATVARHTATARLPQARRRIIENAYFGGLSSVHISRTLGLPSAGFAV